MAGARSESMPRGFTLVELLVVIAIIGVLVSLVAAGLAAAKAKGYGVKCLGNHRQLQIAWHLYAEDNDGRLPMIDSNGGTVLGAESWIGTGTVTDPNNTNALALMTGFGSLGQYTKAVAVYKCPTDRSVTVSGGHAFPHVRSTSMNIYMNYVDGVDDQTLTFRRIDEVGAQGSSRFFVFVDEHEETIRAGAGDFTVFLPRPGQVPYLSHLPSARHNRASPLSFADGHVEMHRWVDERTLKPVDGSIFAIPCPNSKDQQWLEYHATVRLK